MRKVHPYVANASITAQRVVYLNSSNKVAHGSSVATGSTAIPVGVTLESASTNGAVPVVVFGQAKLLFDDTVTAGALVGCDSNGKGVPMPATLPTGSSHAVGVLDDTTVAATNTVAYVFVRPQSLHAAK